MNELNNMTGHAVARCFVVCLLLVGLGCSTGGNIIAPDGSTGMDASTSDAGPRPDAGPPPPNECARLVQDAREAQLDLFMMVDSSGSMEGGPWAQVTFAFDHLLRNPLYDGVGVGLAYFPIVTEGNCGSGESSDYATPEIPIAPLPDNYEPVVSSLSTHLTGGFTPTCAALEGAYTYLEAWKDAHPSHQVAMLFITDGVPTRPDDAECGAIGCSEDTVLSFLRSTSDSDVRIHFIGYSGATTLQDWATAAGTAPAFELSGSASQELIDAIHAIRTQSDLPCAYEIPMPTDGQDVDPGSLNVQFSASADDEPTTIPKNTACDERGGWRYDREGSPTRVELCPTTCDEVTRAGRDARIEIVIGCETLLI